MEEISTASNNPYLKRRRSKVYLSVTINQPESSKIICDYWTDESATPMDGRGNTLLHLLVICGNDDALKNLIKVVVSHENLKKTNKRGDTTLHEAARCGNTRFAVLLLDREKELISKLSCSVPECNCKKCTAAKLAQKESLVTIHNDLGETALHLAAAFGQMALFRTILRYNGNDCTTIRNDGCTVLHAAVTGEYYRTATKILSKRPELAQKCNNDGNTTSNLL